MPERFFGLSRGDCKEALQVAADHKSWFFPEKDCQGNLMDYQQEICRVPSIGTAGFHANDAVSI
jgi:hypothetical protein